MVLTVLKDFGGSTYKIKFKLLIYFFSLHFLIPKTHLFTLKSFSLLNSLDECFFKEHILPKITYFFFYVLVISLSFGSEFFNLRIRIWELLFCGYRDQCLISIIFVTYLLNVFDIPHGNRTQSTCALIKDQVTKYQPKNSELFTENFRTLPRRENQNNSEPNSRSY